MPTTRLASRMPLANVTSWNIKKREKSVVGIGGVLNSLIYIQNTAGYRTSREDNIKLDLYEVGGDVYG